MSATEVVVCEPVRTPIGRYGGMLTSLSAVDLGVAALKGLLARTGIAPDMVDDVIVGHCYPSSEAPAIGRVVALDTGLPGTVPGMQVDRRCGSGPRNGVLAEEIVPVTVHTRTGPRLIDTDEHPRADTTVDALAELKPLMAEEDPDATVTAGNASGQNDAASMCVVTTRAKADELGLPPLMRLRSWGVAGVAPDAMGIGPVPATAVALAKAGLRLADLDLIELNEAFAAQVLAVLAEWGFGAADRERTNAHGSGISLGHPVGATGGRMLAALARELTRRQGRHGLVTMCIGGGQGLAAVFERIAV